MPTLDIYLRIEQIPNYSPVAPDMMAGPPLHYARDCMRNMGHDDGTIPDTEVNARMLTALVYREYLDASYLVPKPDKLALADVNEPPYHRRVPGTVIYTQPGERLRIHVLNADTIPHSLHVHGLSYGIDSDGSWPLGTQTSNSRRSDEICPGQTWTYTFDVTDKMIGAWPFHDHCHDIAANVNRGLFGGIVVLRRDKKCVPPPRMKLPKDVEELLRGLQTQGPPRALPPLEIVHAAMPDHGMNVQAPVTGHFSPIGAGAISLEEYLHLPNVYPVPKPTDVLHVPLFFHTMGGSGGMAAFDRTLAFNATVEVTFGAAGEFSYHCSIHPSMRGKVIVAAGEAAEKSVNIDDSNPADMKFLPASVAIAPGGKVRWHNLNNNVHTVTADSGAIMSFCFNGRSFVGNTPTIVADTGQKICWYVFNLDFGMMWHNFHLHGQRWQFAQEAIDTRSIGPAESFVVETVAPPVLLLPPAIAKAQSPKRRPKGAVPYCIRGDFLFHCHVEMHMMAGLAGVVRSRQTIWLTPAQAAQLRDETGLPLDAGDNDCSLIDMNRCHALDCGKWEEVAGSPQVCMMHAALLPNTNRVLYWGYGDTRDDISRLWDYSTPAGVYLTPPPPANQPFDVTSPLHNRGLANLWSAEHAFLDTLEGTLLVHGGFTPRESYLFHPASFTWERTPSTTDQRFYSTTLTLADGRVLTLWGGSPSSIPSPTIEIYTPNPGPGAWGAPIPFPPGFDYLYYPWTYLLPGGDLFIAGPRGITKRFNSTAPVSDPAKTWATVAGNRSTGGEKGTSVLFPLQPPDYKPQILIAGGNTAASQQTFEIMDLSSASPAWVQPKGPDGVTPLLLNHERPEQVNTVLLPDGRIFLAGGVAGEPGPTELFDTENPSAGWVVCGAMKYPRCYHSSAILLADGSVLMGGDQNNMWKSGETTPNERYYPSYYFLARPAITSAPMSTKYGAIFAIESPDAPSITEIVLLRPGAVTHGFNMSQRFIGCTITGNGATSIQVKAPPDGNIAPPGWYLLFIVNSGRVPSVAKWIRLTP